MLLLNFITSQVIYTWAIVVVYDMWDDYRKVRQFRRELDEEKAS